MSQNPRGSDPYDYNPDYNRLNEQYNQNGQYGQNTQYDQGSYGQYGQNSYVQDSYGQNQYDPYGQQYQQPGQYGQPMMVPISIVQKTPEQLAGEKAGQTSMVLGIIGLICNFFVSWWLFGLPSLIMGVIGIMKANEAERFGTAASGGRIMGWINAAFGGLFLVVFGGILLLGLIGVAGAASSSSNHFTELVSTLALF